MSESEKVASYDPSEDQIMWGSVPLSGWASGSYVTIQQDGESFSKKQGADGEVVRMKRVGRMGTAKLTFLSSSLSNDVLNASHATGEIVPFMVRRGNTVVYAAKAWVEKPADIELSDEASDREWTIALAKIDPVKLAILGDEGE